MERKKAEVRKAVQAGTRAWAKAQNLKQAKKHPRTAASTLEPDELTGPFLQPHYT